MSRSSQKLISDPSRKKGKKGRIHPDLDSDQGYNNKAYNKNEYIMKEFEKGDNREIEAVDKFRNAASKISKNSNPLNLLTNLKVASSKWKKYVTTRRSMKSKAAGGDGEMDRRKTGGIGLDTELREDYKAAGHAKNRLQQIASNRNLIQYFARLGQSGNEGECIDLDFVDSLVANGACINCTDKYGQSLLHEVARAWHVDVAQFLMENGANLNQADNFGRTPLHVAAAVDYPEMVHFLIDNGASKEAQTKNELQTPVHFAARNDACQSLKALIKKNCLYKEVRDYKGRTPLHVAAELDRSETARMLLELDDPAPSGVEDCCGQAAMVWMITKMAPVAKIALDQFHTTDRANRKQYFHLHHLEPRIPDDKREGCPQTALQVIVRFRQYDLVTHPAVFELIRIKWNRFGKFGAWKNIIFNILFILSWTTIGMATASVPDQHIYKLPGEWWRILIFIIAILLTAWQIKDELLEFYFSRKAHSLWSNWREGEIDKDCKLTHPRWPEEEEFLLQEKRELDKLKPQYFNDFWNIFDWICYTLLLVCITIHLVDVFAHSALVSQWQIRIMAITIILIWLRLMKNARAFSYLGPFIVMLSHMTNDIVRFLILYLEFYIPFACAFWMLFGGPNKIPEAYWNTNQHELGKNNTVTVDGYQDVSALLFSMFRLTLVDEYDYAGMKTVDSLMADLLVGFWLALSAIVMLNLFIALMSDTFQRVYDNAKANAVMQKAITILAIEEGLSRKRRNRFRQFIHEKCAPEEKYYDDDTTTTDDDDLKKVTIQIKDDLDDLREALQSTLTNQQDEDDELNKANKNKRLVSVEKLEKEVDILREEMADLRECQEDAMDEMAGNMETIIALLQQIASGTPPSDGMGSSLLPRRSGKPRDRLAPLPRNNGRQKNLKRRQAGIADGVQGLLASTEDTVLSDDDPLLASTLPNIEISAGYSSGVGQLSEVHVTSSYSAGSVHPPDAVIQGSEGAAVHIRSSVMPTDERPPASDC